MISSGEVSQMFAGQQQMFMAQNQFANQIGVAPPPMPQFMGGGPQPYSFAPRGPMGPGLGGGNALAGGVMSGIGGIAGGIGTGIGALGLGGAFGMFGGVGRVAQYADPFGAGQLGWGAARSMGMGMMGRVGGAALFGGGVAAAGMMAGQAIGSFVQGGQQQQMIGNTLGQNFQFNNPMARGGQGFTRDDTMAIGQSIRSLAHVPEMMTSVEELTKLLPKMKSMGVMQGVKDAAEFSSRFKESVKTIRDISKMMGTTMEEATKFFEHSRSVGFLGRRDQLQNLVNSQFTSGLTGMSMQQVAGMQAGGAQMALGMGARRSLGVRAVTNIAQSIGQAQQEGRIGEGALEDITGLEGPEAVAAASQRFTGMMANVGLQSSAGRAIIAGAMKMENGRAVIDKEKIAQLRSGKIGLADIKRSGMNLTNEQKISFTNRKEDLAMEFAGELGPGGFGGFMQELVGGKGDEAVRLMLRRHGGASAGEADIMMNLAGGRETGEQEKRIMAQIRAREAGLREKTDPKAILQKIKTKMHAKMFGGIEEAGAKVFNDIGNTFDEFVDDLVGRHVIEISDKGMKDLSKAFSSGQGKQELRKMFDEAAGGGRALTRRGGGGDSLGRSMVAGMMAWGDDTKTGYTVEEQRSNLADSLGVKGDTGKYRQFTRENVDKTIQERHEKLTGIGSSRALTSARGAMATVIENVKAKNQGFESMDNDKKLQLMSEELQRLGVKGEIGNLKEEDFNDDAYGNLQKGLTPEDMQLANELKRAAQTAQGMGADFKGDVSSQLAIMLGTGGRSDRLSKDMVSRTLTGASQFSAVKDIQAAMKENEAQLTSKFGAGTVAIIKKGNMADALGKAMGKDQQQINDILLDTEMGPKDKAKKLSSLIGAEVSADDLENFKQAHDTIRAKGGTAEDLKTYSAGLREADKRAFSNTLKDAASDIEDKDLQSAVRGLSAAVDKGDKALSDSGVDAVENRIKALVEEAKNEKDPDKRKAIIRKAGVLGVGVEQGVSIAERAKGLKGTGKQIAEKLGVKYEDIADLLKGSGINTAGARGTLTEKTVQELQDRAAVSGGMGALLKGGKTQVAGATEDPLSKTLSSLDEHLKTSNTVMAALALSQAGGGDQKKQALEYLDKVKDKLTPTP